MALLNLRTAPSAVAFCAILAGCGDGGGGGVASTPPPPAVNVSLASLVASQNFANDAATHTASFDLANATTISGSSAGSTLTVQYDASTKTYTLSTQGRSQSFTPADIASNGNGLAVFKTSSGSYQDTLSLNAATFGGTGGPQYVGLGFWQRNAVNGTTQSTSLDIFTSGLATPVSGIPSSGQATLSTYVFGLSTSPGYEPAQFSGSGQFNIDFQKGIFTTTASVTETDLVSGTAISGGGIGLTGAGTLSSSNGTLTGLIYYGGRYATTPGTLSGQLYGPTGQEVGATFSGNGADGSAISGALVGFAPTGSSLTSANLSLTNLVSDQIYYTLGETLHTTNAYPITAYYTSIGVDNDQLTQHVSGGFDIPADFSLPPVQFSASDKIAGGPANFTTYQKTVSGQTETAEIYNSGSTNTELALTYLSFAHIYDGTQSSTATQQTYEIFGIPTADYLLIARTGTAHYTGVAYGAGGNSTTGASYSITGTSSFDANFTNQTLAGTINLSGTGSAGSINFGAFGFSGNMLRGQGVTTALNQGATAVGTITPQFFGPTGQEIGAPFQLNVPAGSAGAGTSIAGAAVAKGG